VKVAVSQNTLFTDAVSHEYLKKMVSNLIKLLYLLNMSANNSFLLLEHSDRSVHFNVHKFLVVKVFESNWDFILTFLIEDDFEGSCIVIDLETCAHGLFNLVGHSSYDDDIVDCFSFDFADVVRSWLCFLYHLHCDWSKNSVFTSLTWEVSAHVLGFTTKATILTTSIAVASAVWLEESIVVV